MEIKEVREPWRSKRSKVSVSDQVRGWIVLDKMPFLQDRIKFAN